MRTNSIFFSANTVKSANKFLMTNSPGLMSSSMTGPECNVLSFCAPHGSTIALLNAGPNAFGSAPVNDYFKKVTNTK